MRMSILSIFHCIRTIRNEKLLNFTKPGNPGYALQKTHDKIFEALRLDASVLEEGGIQKVLDFVETPEEDEREDGK